MQHKNILGEERKEKGKGEKWRKMFEGKEGDGGIGEKKLRENTSQLPINQ